MGLHCKFVKVECEKMFTFNISSVYAGDTLSDSTQILKITDNKIRCFSTIKLSGATRALLWSPLEGFLKPMEAAHISLQLL